MKKIEIILIEAAVKALGDEDIDFKDAVRDDLNLFDMVDSFSIVNILLETEAAIESEYGKYIALANENTFDAVKSPFNKWESWVGYVVKTIGDNTKK